MRVIAGKKKGKRLLAPATNETRPTGDRTKETIFNLIQYEVHGAKCADLFAGSGALGIEALSRGAKSCVFVEKNEEALACLNKNLEACALEKNILNNDIFKALPLLANMNTPLDLIFADPPYFFPNFHKVIARICEDRLLSEAGLLIIEHDQQTEAKDFETKLLKIFKERSIGKTRITLFQYENP